MVGSGRFGELVRLSPVVCRRRCVDLGLRHDLCSPGKRVLGVTTFFCFVRIDYLFFRIFLSPSSFYLFLTPGPDSAFTWWLNPPWSRTHAQWNCALLPQSRVGLVDQVYQVRSLRESVGPQNEHPLLAVVGSRSWSSTHPRLRGFLGLWTGVSVTTG